MRTFLFLLIFLCFWGIWQSFAQGKAELPVEYFSEDGTLFVNHAYKLDPKVTSSSDITFFYSWNEEPWDRIKEPMYPPKSGWNEIRMYSEDQLGNKSIEQRLGVFVDLRSPVVDIQWKTMPRYWESTMVTRKSNEIILRAIDLESGIRTVELRLDGKVVTLPMNERSTWTIPVGEEGRHHLEFFAVDQVMNFSRRVAFDWIVDDAPPELKLVLNPSTIEIQDKIYCKRNSIIRLVGQDKHTEIKDYLWRKKGIPQWNSSQILKIEYLFPLETELELEFSARDFMGNETLPIAFACVLDRKNPTTNLDLLKLPETDIPSK